MLEKIIELIHKVVGNKNMVIDENTVILKELKINSYEIVELICAFEEEFDVYVPDKKIKSLVTIGDVIRYIESQR